MTGTIISINLDRGEGGGVHDGRVLAVIEHGKVGDSS